MCYKCNNIISRGPTQNVAVQTVTIGTQIVRNTEGVREGIERVRLVYSDWRAAVADWGHLEIKESREKENNEQRNKTER